MNGFRASVGIWVVVGCLVGAGCQAPPAHPPQSPVELEAYRRSRSQEFTGRAIVLHNLNRVMSESLAEGDRLESLRVVERLDSSGVEIYPTLALALANPDAPLAVRHGVLAFLIRKDYPGLGRHVAAALPHAREAKLRSAILDWLYEHPSPDLMAEVVKLWAADESIDEGTEARYRAVTERMSGKRWEKALLDALNADGFFGRGSAMEVLAGRVSQSQLRRRIAELKPKTHAAYALQYFSERFGYVPRTGQELLAAVVVYCSEPERLGRTAKLVFEWQTHYGYRFNIRDFHLLSRLASDPLRKPLPRAELIQQLSLSLATRRKATAGPAVGGAGSPGSQSVSFEAQAERLSMADLWNLLLMDEMLKRPRARRALSIMAQGDRADEDTQWGGLIAYDQGQAEARLYPPMEKQGDDQYVAAKRMLEDAFDAMGFFVGHFGRTAPAVDGMRPSKRELDFARDRNLYGLILARPAIGRLTATYVNPEGKTVDLGDYSILP